ncbi:MAG: hypothetical protein N2508_02845 [Anaerolineae bacterium]|nr:hypothetical protein [Anaerolineae bacterium]
MEKRRFSVLLAITIAVLTGSIAATYPRQSLQGGRCEYFVETRHYVCDAFLDFYKTRGGVEIFGYPITEAFDDQRLGLRVQYFQNFRMEWHPTNPDPYKVLLGLLVDELGYKFPPARPEQIPRFNSRLHHYFPETGHVVSYSFLDYFRAKGGIDIFGYPRSEFMYENGLIVQYFQRARMEWHPEYSPPRMRLTPLGQIYVERVGGIPPEALTPQYPPAGPAQLPGTTLAPEPTVTRLNVSATVRYIITGREGGQTVFVYVTDQRNQPIQGASIRITVKYPAGDQVFDFEELTNESGFARHYFEIQPTTPGQKVVVDVVVTYGGLTGRTQTFFLPWW